VTIVDAASSLCRPNRHRKAVVSTTTTFESALGIMSSSSKRCTIPSAMIGTFLRGAISFRIFTSPSWNARRNGLRAVELDSMSECRGNVRSKSRMLPANSILKERILGHIARKSRRRRNSLQITPGYNEVIFKRTSAGNVRGARSANEGDSSEFDCCSTRSKVPQDRARTRDESIT
jgi:hypothetical protein